MNWVSIDLFFLIIYYFLYGLFSEYHTTLDHNKFLIKLYGMWIVIQLVIIRFWRHLSKMIRFTSNLWSRISKRNYLSIVYQGNYEYSIQNLNFIIL